MNTIFSSSSFLYPNNCPSNMRLFGCMITIPVYDDPDKVIRERVTCRDCGCLKETEASVCPLCSPMEYQQLVTTGKLESAFVIGRAALQEVHIISVAIDLAIPEDIIMSMLDTFESDEFAQSFQGFLFTGIFLGTSPIHVTLKNDQLDLCFGEFFEENQICFKAQQLGQLLREAFKLVKMIVQPLTDRSAFELLFQHLSLIPIQNLFLFCATELHLEKVPLVDVKFCVNFVEFAETADKIPNSVLLPFNKEWTHCMATNWRPDLVNYLLRRVENVRARSVRIQFKFSDGIEVNWAAGMKNERTMKHWKVETVLKNYTADVSVTFTAQGSQKYNQETHFGLQVEYEFDNGETIVVNKIWTKAASMEEWVGSLNILNLCAISLKQQSIHALICASQGKQLCFDKKYVWNLANFQAENSPINFAKQFAPVFKALVIDDSSLLPLIVRREIMFHVAREGPSYVGYLSRCIMEHDPDSNSIRIPPFLVTSEPVDVEQDDQCDAFMTNMICPDFKKLQQQISSIMKK